MASTGQDTANLDATVDLQKAESIEKAVIQKLDGLNQRVQEGFSVLREQMGEMPKSSKANLDALNLEITDKIQQISQSLNLIQNSLVDHSTILAVGITLFAVSVACCLAYITLPDYRYRDRVGMIMAEIFLESREEDTVDTFLNEYRKMPIEKRTPTVIALRTYLRMPRGSYKDDRVNKEQQDACELLRGYPGKFYLNWLEVHTDNKTCTGLVAIGIVCAFVFSETVLITVSFDFQR